MIRSKILATLGPAVADVETLLKLFAEGVSVCRMNFSHGELPDHMKMLRLIREAAARHDQPIAVLGDLGGPKIRLTTMPKLDGTDGVPIEAGQRLTLRREQADGDRGVASTTYPGIVDDVQIGHRVLVEDGLLRFLCVEKNYNELTLNCTAGGVLQTRKGVNLPDSELNLPSITDRDWACVDWAVENDLDFLALSFVRTGDDLERLREHLQYKGSGIDLIAKIETPQAVKNIEGVLAASDGLMVARGDLGVEMDVAEVPIIQKDLIRRCQRAGKPVIVATQMLQSMVDQSSPTRAEVSDVANAVFDGADAVMLSGETSVGKYPVAAVHVMARVCAEAERYVADHPEERPQLLPEVRNMRLSNAIASGVRQVVEELGPKLVVVYSQSGDTARIFSKHRLPVPLVALSSSHRTLRQMSLHYGTRPMEMPTPSDLRTLVSDVDELILARDLVHPGDRVVIVAGASMGTPGAMNGIIVHTVGQPVRDVCADGA
jgi:pyruvate kinase